MLNVIRRGTLLAIAAPFQFTDYDVVSESSKTAEAYAKSRPELETGKDRLYAMFSTE